MPHAHTLIWKPVHSAGKTGSPTLGAPRDSVDGVSQIDVFFQYEADHEDTSVRLCTVAVPIDGPWICDSKKVARDGQGSVPM